MDDKDKLSETLLDICDRQEEADEAIQEYWPQLESVVNAEIMNCLKTVYESLETIGRLATSALGGSFEVVKLRAARESEDEEAE